MQGLDAIGNANGWAMAIVGASIVITGLSVLSFLISQLHRLVDLLENKNSVKLEKLSSINNNSKKITPNKISEEIGELSKTYISFTSKLGSSFTLLDLYQLSNKMELPHPHISIRNFRNEGILIPTGKELFSWKSIST